MTESHSHVCLQFLPFVSLDGDSFNVREEYAMISKLEAFRPFRLENFLEGFSLTPRNHFFLYLFGLRNWVQLKALFAIFFYKLFS